MEVFKHIAKRTGFICLSSKLGKAITISAIAFLFGLITIEISNISIAPLSIAFFIAIWAIDSTPHFVFVGAIASSLLIGDHNTTLCLLALTIALALISNRLKPIFAGKYIVCALVLLTLTLIICDSSFISIISFLFEICIIISISLMMFLGLSYINNNLNRSVKKLMSSSPFGDHTKANGIDLTKSNHNQNTVMLQKKLDSITERVKSLSKVLYELSDMFDTDDFARRQFCGISYCLNNLLKKSEAATHIFDVNIGCANAPKSGNIAIGDSYIIDDFGNRVMVAISDGMGSGVEAETESRRTLEIMTKLLKTGFNTGDAAECVNRLTLLHKDREIYATLDVIVFNLDTGIMNLAKLGAPPSYILRNGKLSTLYAEALPAGIIEEARPALCTVNMRKNDIIIMMSDGVSDALGMNLHAAVCEQINNQIDPGDAANALLSYAVSRCGNRDYSAKDDMTVMIIMVE